MNSQSSQLSLFNALEETVITFVVKDQAFQIDAVDADLLAHNWTLAYGSSHTPSLSRTVEWETVYIHRVIMARVLGRELTRADQVDHEDVNRRNNTRKNLRLATGSQNKANSRAHRDNKLGVKGVHQLASGKYHAQIQINGKRVGLGDYLTVEEAHAAYVKAAKEAYGEFARGE